MFKYEMHLHSCACSACGVSTAREMVQAAADNGYSGVVFTNHFFHGNTAIDRKLAWQQFVAAYREDYIDAKKYAKAFDIDVLFGIEEVYEPGKEALIYGLSPDLIAETPDFVHMNISQISNFVRQNGGFIACAHPFRNRAYIPNPYKEPDAALFDAVEVHNHCNDDITNKMAADFAQRNRLLEISGGDTHRHEDFGHAGVAFPERIRNNKALVSFLKSGNYRLIIDGQIQ